MATANNDLAAAIVSNAALTAQVEDLTRKDEEDDQTIAKLQEEAAAVLPPTKTAEYIDLSNNYNALLAKMEELKTSTSQAIALLNASIADL